MMIRHFTSLVTLALTFGIGLCACNSNKATVDDREGVPEVAAIQMPLTGNATTEGTATQADAVDAQSLAADELDQAGVPATTNAADLGQVRGAVKRLNDSIRDFLGPIAYLVRNEEPSYELGQLKMWGPVPRGETEYRFLLRHAAIHRWGWRLDARVLGSGETYSRVAAGEITVGARPRRGTGVMGFDLDALAAVDPTVTAQGQILVGFRHGDLGTSVGYAVRDFTGNPDTQPGVDALLRAVHLKDGFNRVRMAYHGDVEGTATAAEELVLARIRHQRGVGGRSDQVVLNGDIPTGEAMVVSQCWNKALESGFREVRNCPLDGLDWTSCVVVSSSGDPSACPALLKAAELPPADPNAPMADESDPNGDITAPTEIPTVAGEAAGG
jgi:hypothetical protein